MNAAMPARINLGCGSKRRAGYWNVDLVGDVDERRDLAAFPWPWPDAAFEEVFSEHFLEHVADYERTVLEMHRILRPGGTLHFIVPHFRTPLAVWHLHPQQFSTATPDRLCEALPYQWGGRRLFQPVRTSVRITVLPGAFSRAATALARLAPKLWDWLGWPIDEVEFVGRKI